ncbi:type II toxin-antitoxin system CcdA family antitoxin [Plasticicumulans sp.]|uniref:type II toxin-antitoxin system CcdA family antitoxin n=1 Tax=Plasticicumulans sp. TaxID=2307179 RepID=UPI002BE26FBE|nr:type II toxin-antitoxin system CcdA family antitoxin [Pseudomonadota bacterium]HMV40248.1 type II toxin-antitoxin system CcdA family antitoxin [Plasticicumulans sp.]HNB90762.1 type II toxin-antitoxin system CcdA family antitoxin [Plasticicumulans sp.]
MAAVFDPDVPRTATGLGVSTGLLRQVREFGVPLDDSCERALAEAVRAARMRAWQEENRPWIEAYNAWIAEHGCFGEEYRSF